LKGYIEELSVDIPLDKIEELIENRKCKLTVEGQFLNIEVLLSQDWFEKLTKFYIEVNKNK